MNNSRYWTSWREIPRVCLNRHNLTHTAGVAAIVGTVLFVINQLDVVLSGRATALVWLKVGLTYLVPFCVANFGILVASHRADNY